MRCGVGWVACKIMTEPATRVMVPLQVAVAAGASITAGGLRPVHLIILTAPFWFAMGWGRLNLAGGWTGVASLGIQPRALRAIILLAQCVVTVVATMAATLLVAVTSVVRGLSHGSRVDIFSGLPVNIVEIATTAALTCMLVANRTRWQGAVISGVIPLIDLLSGIRQLPGGEFLRRAWPPIAARTLFSEELTSPRVRVVLSIVVAATCIAGALWAIHLPTRAHEWVWPVRMRYPRPETVVAVAIVACAILPVLLSDVVPPGARPSFLLDRWQGNGPDQVTKSFFHAVWSDRTKDADQLTVDGNYAKALRLSRLLRKPSPNASFVLREISIDGRADVAAYLQTGVAHVCLRKRVDRWQIVSVKATEC